ncbi:MAG: 2'-5' RNA ligase family protein [Chitinophagaceae bacterium]
MTKTIRRQLTLFVSEADAIAIETIRHRYNPEQSRLISSHVTLCREDEIANLEKVVENLRGLRRAALCVSFGPAKRVDNGKGVLIPGHGANADFHQLRQEVLKGVQDVPVRPEPHITLMHPGNSACTDVIFEEIAAVDLPARLNFHAISLIEQVNGGAWKTLERFAFTV